MIETEQTIVIAAPIHGVWDVARDISAWARLLPGLREFACLDADHSIWTLKVGVGALVRTVKASVQVDRWAGPEAVDFTYRLDGDPVQGGGSYRANSLRPNETQITLALWVEGTGPMAPMWEAMSRPLLPKFARSFAEQFKQEVELFATATQAARIAAVTPRPRRLWGLFGWFRRLLGRAADAAH